MSAADDRWSVSLSGVTLLERFHVERKMGGGGMATVYLGKDVHLGLPVVVKVPHPSFLADPSFRTRFEQETEGLIALQHPHIVRILARGEHEGLPFLIMQYLQGGSLGNRMRNAKGTALAFDDVMRWVPGVCEALDFIHARGIVHRDIKPDNVLFDEHGYVYLSDFGIAKAVGDDDTGLTATGATPGSPAYMAPEQARTSNLEGASDQYSLAATLYEALSGVPAYDGETLIDVLLKKQSEDPPHLSERADVPRPAADGIMRALSRNPADRFETCAGLAEALSATETSAVPGRTEALDPAPAVPTETRPAVAAPVGDHPAEEIAEDFPRRPPMIVTVPEPRRSGPPRWLWLGLGVLAVGLAAWLVAGNLQGGGVTPAQAGIEGDYVLDKQAFETWLEKVRRNRPRARNPRPGGGGLKPDPGELVKRGVSLTLRVDRTFSLTTPSRRRGVSTLTTGSWSLAGDAVTFRPEVRDGQRLPGGDAWQGSVTGDRLLMRREPLEIPFRRVP